MGDLMTRWFMMAAGQPPNLWGAGDQTFVLNHTVNLSTPLPAGKYRLIADVTSTDTDDTTCLVILYINNPNLEREYVQFQLPRTIGASVDITLPATYYNAILYASTSDSKSSGDTATFANIKVYKIN